MSGSMAVRAHCPRSSECHNGLDSFMVDSEKKIKRERDQITKTVEVYQF